MQLQLKLNLMEESFIHHKTHEKVKGVTIIVDSDFQPVLDTLMKIKKSYKKYSYVITDALARGSREKAEKGYELFVYDDELQQDQSDKTVKGVRIMITDGLRDILDNQIAAGEYRNYSEGIGAKLKIGISDIISECKSEYMRHE